MRENKLRRIWDAGESVLNGWLQLNSPYAAEIMAHQGWDSLTIDLQHGPVGYEDTLAMLPAISSTDTVPLARVPWNEPGIIMKMLDAGCYGIICPMVNSRAEAEAFVGACRYAPLGYRSYGPNRARLYAGNDYPLHSNETVLAIAMIETAQAVENLDEILSVPGLDALYVGPADLSLSLGLIPPAGLRNQTILDTLEKILAAAQRHGIVPGIHTSSSQECLDMMKMGFRFCTVQSDSRLLAKAAAEVVAAVKKRDIDSEKSAGPY
jgi:4-hydroxy-2-oxoheptanedioate aldolase